MNYAYDGLNRLTDKTYTIPSVNNIPVATATPSVHYQYDLTSQSGALNTVGRLTGETVQQDASVLYQRTVPAYDPMGRIAKDMRCVIPTYCSDLSSVAYTYDLAGHEITGTTADTLLSYVYDGAGRLTAEGFMTADGGQGTLLSGVQYSPFGAISAANGFEQRAYDKRGRTTQITYDSSNLGINYDATYHYYANGNVKDSADSVNGDWTYGYDNLNRLISAVSPVPQIGTQTYSYDSFGNRLNQTGILNHSSTYNNGNNRADCSSCYDASGNVVQDVDAAFPHTYSYDAEGRLSGVTDLGYQYIYDGEGERVAVLQNGGLVREYFHDANGQFYSVFDGNGNETSIEFYGAGRHIFSFSDDTYLPILDALGTERSRIGIYGGTTENCTSLPFGDGMNCSAADPSPLHFTGKERDTESGLDNFGARYYGSNMGRFMSPDDGSDQDLTNPQSLNLYSYVRNNPLTNTDPDGHTCQTNSTDGATYDDMDGQGCATVDQQDAQRLQNGDYDANVNGGGSSSLGTVASNVGNFISGAASSTVNFVSQVGSQLSNIAQTPGGIGCMASLAGSGGAAGAVAGGGVGLVGLAGGGVGVLVTEPAGLAIGGVGGAASGLALGMTVCPGGAMAMRGNGGGGGGSSQAKKLTPGEIAKLKQNGVDPEMLKEETGTTSSSRSDLYKLPNGDIVVKGKGGIGPGEPTGININMLR